MPGLLSKIVSIKLPSESTIYSYFNASTGFILAARNDWYNTTMSAMINPMHVESRNIHGLMLVLYAKFCNHLCMMKYTTGQPIIEEMVIKTIVSRDNSLSITGTDAP